MHIVINNCGIKFKMIAYKLQEIFYRLDIMLCIACLIKEGYLMQTLSSSVYYL